MSAHDLPFTVSRRTVLGAGAGAAGLGLTGLAGPFGSRPAFAADGKTGSTYYTPAKVTNARANIERYGWAASLRDAAIAAAERYVNRTDDELWSLVPAQTVGRSLGVLIRYQARILGAPGAAQGGVGDGAAINRFGNYPWIIDQFAHPWKIKNPANGELYPSNDFASYYAAGLDEHGEFDPALARERGSQFLVNELYPERGEGWGVDDGTGWTDADGHIWTFIAYYCHWGLWYRTGSTTYGLLHHALVSLRDAHLYTGEARYAHKGLVLLDRIADVYPAMDVTAFRWQDGYDNGDPGIHTAQGKTVNDIWETGVANYLIQAYDAFWPAMDDPELLSFVQAKASQYAITTPKGSVAELRQHIEDHVLRLVLPAVRTSQIRGNTGMHHATLALAAVVLDSAGESNEILDYCFQPGALVSVKGAQFPYGRQFQVTGGDLARLLVDAVDRDGNGNESAPGYNSSWVTTLLPMADAVAGYQRYPDHDLFGNVKYRRMFTAIAPMMMLGRYTPTIGDSGNTGGPALVANLNTSIVGFAATKDPVLAQLIALLAKGDLSTVHGSIFDAEPEAIRDEITAAVAEHGPLNPGTTHLTGYGFAGLRQGSGADSRAVWTYYGRSSGHGHLDCLNLGVYGAGMDLAPDLGYPEVTGTDPERLNWTAATVSHNTVVVDEASQKPQWVATPLLLGAGDKVSLSEVESADAYPTLARYRRTTALVEVDEATSYAVDVFRVSGGSSHVFSFHGGPGTVATSGLSLSAQETGSYAGPDVPFRDASWNTAKRAGFNYLDRVERDAAPAPVWSVDWAVRDQWNVHPVDPDAHLRLTMLSPVGDVALADGIPPRNKPGNPASLRYVLARRTGADLTSTFASVIEPYVGTRSIRSSRLASIAGNPAPDVITAVRIELADDRIDYVVSAADPGRDFVIDGTVRFRGRFGWIRLSGGAVTGRWTLGSSVLALVDEDRPAVPAALTGTVVSFTRDLVLDNEIVVNHDPLPGAMARTVERLVGAWVHVTNDGRRNACYRIESVEVTGRNQLRLGLGQQTLVRSLADPNDADGGYVHDVAVGAAMTVPLPYES